jgi:hypothetical protein
MKSANVSRYQRGAALLLIAAAMIVGAAVLSYQIFGNLGAKLKRQNAQEVSQALASAKQSLLTFASMQPELYPSLTANNIWGVGYFPAPDFDNDGRMGTVASAWSNTPATAVVGRLPALSRDIIPFYFYTRSCPTAGTPCANDDNLISIWYAMSGRSIPTTSKDGDPRLGRRDEPLNSITLTTQLDGNANGILDAGDCNTVGVICLDNMPVVAVLMAAGVPLSTQVNRVTNPVDFTQYLDMDNSDSNNSNSLLAYHFISHIPLGQVCTANSNNSSACFNDQVISVSYADWVSIMENRVKSEFSNSNAGICSISWRALNVTHWAVRNEWYSVPSICANPNLP